MPNETAAVAAHFSLDGDVESIREIGDGNINNTWKITCRDGGRVNEYILQRINTYVFRDPVSVMRNITLVTGHIARAYENMGVSPEGRVLKVIPAADGAAYYHAEDDGWYRVYGFIGGASAFNQIDSPALFREAARGFGEFARLLSDFPADSLIESIPGFHHTVRRFAAFRQSVEADRAGRVKDLGPEIDFLMRREKMMGSIVNALEGGEIPLRVAHNDTKINNVMIDRETGRAKCVIDLDTVMPGSYLFDFGDAIRSGAPTLNEESRDYEHVRLDTALFEAFPEGYVGDLKASLTKKEIDLLPTSALVITCEQAMRFLTDYIDGDLYYKIRTPDHNLARARNQMALVTDMERQFDAMKAACEAIAR